jgi:hypothetical protein
MLGRIQDTTAIPKLKQRYLAQLFYVLVLRYSKATA